MDRKFYQNYRGSEPASSEVVEETVLALKKELDRIVSLASEGKRFGFVFATYTPDDLSDEDMDTVISVAGDTETASIAMMSVLTADDVVMGVTLATIERYLSEANVGATVN